MTPASARMQAIRLDRAAHGGLAVHDVDRPRPGAHEALVRVAAVSLGGDEVVEALASGVQGATLGSDLAGTVAAAATDGSGPKVGARVVGLVPSGAWAQLAAVPSDALAELPTRVSFAQAAALPTAGLTAFYGLGYGGLLVAKRVLVTRGAGDVGLYAVQLAHLSGARVTAAIPEPEHEALMEEYGADHVLVGDVAASGALGPFHLVMAAAGDPMTAPALRLVGAGGACVLYGTKAARVAALDEQAVTKRGARLQGLVLPQEMRREPASEALQRLLALAEVNALQPHVELEAGWTEVGTLSRRLLEQTFIGRAVLHL